MSDDNRIHAIVQALGPIVDKIGEMFGNQALVSIIVVEPSHEGALILGNVELTPLELIKKIQETQNSIEKKTTTFGFAEVIKPTMSVVNPSVDEN